MELAPGVAATGVRHIAYEAVGSTNVEALALARAGERGPLWVTAARQTAGRGRRGRIWVSEPGNLYASLLLTDPAPPRQGRRALLRGRARVRDADCGRLRARRCPGSKLKWPNDLLLDGAKLAGILIEAEGARPLARRSIGIGINCAHHPGTAGELSGDGSCRGRRVRVGARSLVRGACRPR